MGASQRLCGILGATRCTPSHLYGHSPYWWFPLFRRRFLQLWNNTWREEIWMVSKTEENRTIQLCIAMISTKWSCLACIRLCPLHVTYCPHMSRIFLNRWFCLYSPLSMCWLPRHQSDTRLLLLQCPANSSFISRHCMPGHMFCK